MHGELALRLFLSIWFGVSTSRVNDAESFLSITFFVDAPVLCCYFVAQMKVPAASQSVCPTCGTMLPTAHLVQLNCTLQLLLDANKEHVSINLPAEIKAVVEEIIRVSSNSSMASRFDREFSVAKEQP